MVTSVGTLGRLTDVMAILVVVVMVALWSSPLVRPVSGECCEPTWVLGCPPSYNTTVKLRCLDCQKAYFIFHNCGSGCNLFGCRCDSCNQLKPGVVVVPNHKPKRLHNPGKEGILP